MWGTVISVAITFTQCPLIVFMNYDGEIDTKKKN